MAIQFKELKKYLSRVTRISICFRDGHYDNYLMVSDIPEEKYDELYVYGVGMIDVEFPLDVYVSMEELQKRIWKENGFFLGCALEIVLQEEPRELERNNMSELTFGDLRGYLQAGRNFSITKKEEWAEENFVYRNEIPEHYNDMYVYGIGIDDNFDDTLNISPEIYADSYYFKKLKIVVSERTKND